jgi:nucleoside-diphosphate-sugar epimerase
MKRCVMTGGSGLIGSHITQSLHRQWQICSLSRTVPTDQVENVEFQPVDLSAPWDTHALPREVDAVIHLAQSEQFREFPERAEQVLQVNTVSTLRLLDYARRAGARTFIYASSGGIHGYDAREFSEGVATPSGDDLGFYLSTKLCAEILAENYTPFMNVIVLRFFFVYGVGQNRSMLIPRLVQSVIDRKPIILHGEDGLRLNPTYVSDAAAAIHHALALNGSHKINIGGPEVLTLRELGHLIGKAVGKEPIFEVQSQVAPRHLVGDINKMTPLLGSPQIGFAEGIRLYVQSLERSV